MLNNIIIIGITGVGKTTVGKILAEKLNKSFIDLDRNIESHCGVDIQRIFGIEGEEGFRQRETDELKRIIDIESCYVLSLGGGCVLKEINRKLITNNNHFIIQLFADVDILVERLSHSATKRPMFNGVDVASKIVQVYEERKSLYDLVTNLKINTSNLRAVQVAELIEYKINSL
ncbi:MAG: AAA family ATPase [Burkholderiales bacterium]|nr:AAA family ATPase [Burkholderiales bacterium]